MSPTEETAQEVAALQPVEYYYIPVILLTIFLNTTLLAVISYQSELQEVMRFLYKLSSGVHIILGMVWGLWSMLLFSLRDHRSCTIMSKVFPFPVRAGIICSMACHCAISLNLYLMVSKPLRYHRIVTLARVRAALIVVFALIVLLNFMYLPLPCLKLFFTFFLEKCMDVREENHETWLLRLQAACMITPASISLALITLIYVKLFTIGLRKKRVIANVEMPPRNACNAIEQPGEDNGNKVISGPDRVAHRDKIPIRLLFRRRLICGRRRNHMILNERSKGIITVFIVTGSAVIAYTPFVIFHASYQVSAWHTYLDKIAISLNWIEPLVYLLTNQEAKKLLRRMICRHDREVAMQN